MKVAKILTCNALIYYSLKGNTLGVFKDYKFDNWDIYNLRNRDIEIDLNKYSNILIGTSTYGRGDLPRPFIKIKDQLIHLQEKNIGLFGSGRTEYEYFCGGVDLLEYILKAKNNILFKFKFEGYPRPKDKEEFKRLMEEYKNEIN